MYKSFFNLKINPFASSPDPRFLYMMPHTREALATLEYGISAHKGFIVLTGEVGTGKTTLLRRALASMDQSRVFSFVRLQSAAGRFGFPRVHPRRLRTYAAEQNGSRACLIRFNRWLIERYRRDETSVIIVDEAQNLQWELPEEIRLPDQSRDHQRETGADRSLRPA